MKAQRSPCLRHGMPCQGASTVLQASDLQILDHTFYQYKHFSTCHKSMYVFLYMDTCIIVSLNVKDQYQ